MVLLRSRIVHGLLGMLSTQKIKLGGDIQKEIPDKSCPFRIDVYLTLRFP